jgi:hypothetical protein
LRPRLTSIWLLEINELFIFNHFFFNDG